MSATRKTVEVVKKTKISTLLLRLDLNLESVCFYALITFFTWIARRLGFTSGKIAVQFVSTFAAAVRKKVNLFKGVLSDEQAQQVKELSTTAAFNVGGHYRGWDSHGKANCDEICSINVALDEYDFLAKRPWLKKLIRAVIFNDIDGKGVSRHRYNLRALIQALSAKYPHQPDKVLQWGTLAFYGVFTQVIDGQPFQWLVDKNNKNSPRVTLFDPGPLRHGVTKYLARQAGKNLNATEVEQKQLWFNSLLDEATEFRDQVWTKAVAAVEIAAKDAQNVRTVQLPSVNRPIKIMLVYSSHFLIPQASRHLGYDVAIQYHPRGLHVGQVQIHSSLVETNGQKYKLDLGPVIAALRQLEAYIAQKHIMLEDQKNLEKTGLVYTTDDEVLPGYMPPCRSQFLYGSPSSPDAPKTKILGPAMLSEVAKYLPLCKLVARQVDRQAGRRSEPPKPTAVKAPEPITPVAKPTSAPPNEEVAEAVAS